MIDDKTEAALIQLVRQVARAEIMPRFRRLDAADIATKAGPEDLVTEADLRSEAAIAEGVKAILPDTLIVGEEAVESDPSLLEQLAQAKQSVVIDPVDGTWNFAKGLSTFGVILAVLEEGKSVFGLLYDPVLDDWVRTRRGGGTWYETADGHRHRLRFGPEPPHGLTGFVPLFQYPEAQRGWLTSEALGVRCIWSVRCSCHEYRTMVLGGADFCLSSGLKPWDHAAGALAVEEAGGAVGLLDGRDYQPSAITAGILVSARSASALADARQRFSPLQDGKRLALRPEMHR